MATQIYHASSDAALQDGRFASPMEQLLRWLPAALPSGDDELRCLVHGDLHAEHVLFHPTQPTIAAVGGWEHWCYGHPGADLAMLALPYVTPGTLNTKHQGYGLPASLAATQSVRQPACWAALPCSLCGPPSLALATARRVLQIVELSVEMEKMRL